MNDEPEIEYSKLSQEMASDGQAVSVEIYRLEGAPEWQLEVVDEYGNSTVWGNAFENESAALSEAQRTILVDGIGSLIGPEGDEKLEGWL